MNRTVLASTLCGAAFAVVLAACVAGSKSPSLAVRGADGEPPKGMHERQLDEIEIMWQEVRTWRDELGLRREPKADPRWTSMPLVRNLCPDYQPHSQKCTDTCDLANHICDNAEDICRIADDLKDNSWANEKCGQAKQSCKEAKETCCHCNGDHDSSNNE